MVAMQVLKILFGGRHLCFLPLPNLRTVTIWVESFLQFDLFGES